MPTRRSRLSLLVLAVVASGCDAPPGATVDGGVPLDAPAELVVALPVPPAIPWIDAPPVEAPRVPWLTSGGPPVRNIDIPWFFPRGAPPLLLPDFRPCPPGWIEEAADEHGLAACAPWPTDHVRCAATAEMHLPGTAACATVGSACPAGAWPADLPAGRPLVYVSASAAAGGDGTVDRPLTSLTDALAAAPAGATIVVGAGSYVGEVAIPAGIEVRGVCAERVELTSDGGVAVVRTAGTGATLRDVTIAAGAREAVRISAGTDVVLEGLVVESATGAAIHAVGGTLTVRRSRVVSVSRGAGDGSAVRVEGGTATIESSSFEDLSGVGVLVTGEGTEASIDDTVIDGVDARADGTFGYGISAEVGAHVVVGRVVIMDTRSAGAFAASPRTQLTGEWVVVSDITVQPSDETLGGIGIAAANDGYVALQHVLVERTGRTGAASLSAGSQLGLTDAIVRDVGTHPTLRAGSAILAAQPVALERVAIRGARTSGVTALGAAGSVRARDVMIRDVIPAPADPTPSAGGLDALGGAQVEIERLDIGDVDSGGVLAVDASTRIIVSDLHVHDVGDTIGVSAEGGARVQITRGMVEDLTGTGVGVDGSGSTVVATDVVVRHVGASPTPDVSSAGFSASHSGSLTVTRGFANDVDGVGVAANAATASFTHLVVRDVVGGAPTAQAGVVARDGATVTVRLAEIDRIVGRGLVAQGSSVLTVEDAVVRAWSGEPAAEVGAILALQGARATVRRVLLEQGLLSGVKAQEGAELIVEDLVVRRLVPAMTPEGGEESVALSLVEGAMLTGDRVVVEDCIVAMYVRASSGELADLRATGCGRYTGEIGTTLAVLPALTVDEGGTLSLARAHLLDGSGPAIMVSGAGSALMGEDLAATFVRLGSELDAVTRAIEVQDGASLSLDRARVGRDVALGILAQGSLVLSNVVLGGGDVGALQVAATGSAELRSVEVHEVGVVGVLVDGAATVQDLALTGGDAGSDGRGIQIARGAQVTMDRVRIARVRELGIIVGGDGTAATMRDLTIEDVRPARCGEDGTCPGMEAGFGISVVDSGRADLERFRLLRADLAAVAIAGDAMLDLRRGSIESSPIGINVQVPSYDLTRLADGVTFVDVDTRLDSSELPIPMAIASFDE